MYHGVVIIVPETHERNNKKLEDAIVVVGGGGRLKQAVNGPNEINFAAGKKMDEVNERKSE